MRPFLLVTAIALLSALPWRTLSQGRQESAPARNPPARIEQASQPIDWYQEYNSRWPDGITPSSTLPWSETYTIRSYVSMYRAAKARGESAAERMKWIDRLIQHCDAVVASPAMNAEGKAYLVYAGHGFTPLSRVVKMIFRDDALYALYKDRANAYLRYLETEIVPYWRDPQRAADWRLTPFNWYLSYGSLVMNLHQITRLPRYRSPWYDTPDTSLKHYYSATVSDFLSGGFRDFGQWEYATNVWQWANTVAPRLGLCYAPAPRDAYVWRYYDFSDNLVLNGNGTELAGTMSLRSGSWYHLFITRSGDSVRMRCYDSTDATLLFDHAALWTSAPTPADLIIGRRPDAQVSAYFQGVIDELKISRNGTVIAYWPFDSSAQDVSGNAHHGTVHGTPQYVPGRIGTGLRFSYDDVTVPHHADFDSFTDIDCWINLSECSPKYYNYILGKGTGFPDSAGFYLSVYSYKRPEDVGHANLDIEFLVKVAHDSLFAPAFPRSALTRFCNTFTRIVWSNGDSAAPAFRSHLHPDTTYGDPDADVHSFRWLWLYEYEPLVGTLISNWYRNHPSARMSEAVANLACWQAGLPEDDSEAIPTGIREAPAPAERRYEVFPNPSTDRFVVRSSHRGEVAEVTVFDVLGNEIRSLRGQDDLIWDGKDGRGAPAPRGCYILVVRDARGMVLRNIVLR